MRSGIIVAGGYSTRFGAEDKALAEVDGAPMLRHVARALDAVVDELVVNCREEQREAFAEAVGDLDAEVRFAVDPIPDRGPVAGLRTGLRFARADVAAVAACDVPSLEPDVLAYAFERFGADPVDAVVPRVDGHVQPLCGVYDVAAARDACSLAIDRGERRLLSVVSYLTARIVTESTVAAYADPDALRSVDTPDAVPLADAEASEESAAAGTTHD